MLPRITNIEIAQKEKAMRWRAASLPVRYSGDGAGLLV
jgi:hypothetical protein